MSGWCMVLLTGCCSRGPSQCRERARLPAGRARPPPGDHPPPTTMKPMSPSRALWWHCTPSRCAGWSGDQSQRDVHALPDSAGIAAAVAASPPVAACGLSAAGSRQIRLSTATRMLHVERAALPRPSPAALPPSPARCGDARGPGTRVPRGLRAPAASFSVAHTRLLLTGEFRRPRPPTATRKLRTAPCLPPSQR